MLPDPAIRAPIAISLGAIAGALSRYYLTLWFTQTFGNEFPYGTFFINLTGCVGMGMIATLAIDRVGGIPPEVRLLIAVGFLGSYTTFSTYGLDSLGLWQKGLSTTASLRQIVLFGVYWAGSALLGIMGVYLGAVLVRKLS